MDVVSIEISGNIGLIKIDYPPVNAAGHAVRTGLVAAVTELDRNDLIRVIAIYGAGRTFVAGADIREFGKPVLVPNLPDVVNAVESCDKLVIACIHGNALGGGLEIALGCHYRIAIEGSKLGLPEVTLGILPGAGGTQRTPRLIGLEPALEMIVSGNPISAERAFELGLIDKIVAQSEPREIALDYARELVDSNAPVRRTRDADRHLHDGARAETIVHQFKDQLAQSAKHLFSPHKCVDAVAASLQLPFEDALKKERRLFVECMESPQRKGLIHAFFAQRRANKIPELNTASPNDINRVAVIGGGTMGAGISATLLFAGLTVTMIEKDGDAASRGQGTLLSILQGALDRNKLDQTTHKEILANRFSATHDLKALSEADLAIEAVYEDFEVKRRVFEILDDNLPDGAILATNTSYLDINRLAESTSRPEKVIGLHFFSPAHIMKLLEIVVADKTSDTVTATAFSLAKRLGKIAVRAGVCDGFIGNRILAHYRKAADYMVEDGASPYQIDSAIREFGFAMGPYQTADLAGLDIGWANRKRLAPTRDPQERYVEIADMICERGWLGRKSGRGYYRYDECPAGQPDPEIEHLIDTVRSEKGIKPRRFTDREIVDRYLAAMINEGSRVVNEGIALRPLDIDVTLLFGYGFPRWHGGPMKYADMRGLSTLVQHIEQYGTEDAFFWRPAELLVSLAEEKSSFDSLNT